MGTKIGDIIPKRPIGLEELTGKAIAFDAYNVMYQFLASIRTPEGFLLTGKNGRVVSHLKGLLSRTSSLMSKGIRPVFVFDGIPHELKSGVLDLRRIRKEKAMADWQSALERGDLELARVKAQQTSRLSPEMIEDAIHMLDLMGIPIVKAPGEGEAQASMMVSEGIVYSVASQDLDSLLFGADRLLRNMGLSMKRKLPGRKEYVASGTEIIHLSETLESLGLTREQLVDLAILVGTDFNEGVKGIGAKKALAMIREFGSLEDASKANRIPLLEWDEVRSIFLAPNVDKGIEPRWRNVDEEGLIAFLCDGIGFGQQGVKRSIEEIHSGSEGLSQSSLDIFF